MSRASATIVLFFVACAPMWVYAEGNPVAEAGYISIGGIQQWVTIRGDDDEKPVLFYVHGGPGAAQSAYVETYAPFEKDFILVQWDQRGSGQTFKLLGQDTPDFTPARLIADGVEVADYLRRRFPDNAFVLLGHSYGSFIATGIRQQRPKLFSAYVGTGQFTQLEAGMDYQKDYLLKSATDSGDEATVIWLQSQDTVTANGRWFGTLSRYMGESDKQWLESIPNILATSSVIDADGIDALIEGQNFSGSRLVGTLTAINLFQTASHSQVPFCIIQGSEDVQTPTQTVEAYFETLETSEKAMYVLEGAGHFAIATHTPEFISTVKKCPGVMTN